MTHPESWNESPDAARETWHTEARERDEAYVALGPVNYTERHHSPWAGGAELPGLAQEVGHEDTPGRPWRELSESGLLWLINAVVFHPRGFALALSMNTRTGEVTGWDVLGDGTQPWSYADPVDDRFAAAEDTLASYRRVRPDGRDSFEVVELPDDTEDGIGLGDSSVRFKLPGRAWVDVRVQGDWVICMSADQMLAHPQSGNVMALRSARRGEL